MITLAAIALLALSHVIYRHGKNGCRVSIRFEKVAVFLAAIVSLAAIFELGSWVTFLFVREEDDFSG